MLLKKGDNHFLFQGGRGTLKWRLYTAPAEVFILAQDARMPDVVGDETEPGTGTLAVVNASTKSHQCALQAWEATVDFRPAITNSIPNFASLPPLSTRKLPVAIPPLTQRATEKLAPESLRLGKGSRRGKPVEAARQSARISGNHCRAKGDGEPRAHLHQRH